MNRREAIENVVSGLSFLILNHSTCVAREQYTPDMDPDKSDNVIKENKEFVSELRKLRDRFEDLVTGVL